MRSFGVEPVGESCAKKPLRTMSRLWRHAASVGQGHFVDESRTIEDDHLAYHQAGIPALDIIDAGRPATFPPQWDTAGDLWPTST